MAARCGWAGSWPVNRSPPDEPHLIDEPSQCGQNDSKNENAGKLSKLPSGHPHGGRLEVREAIIGARNSKSEIALKATKPIAKSDLKQRGCQNHHHPIEHSIFHARYAAQRKAQARRANEPRHAARRTPGVG